MPNWVLAVISMLPIIVFFFYMFVIVKNMCKMFANIVTKYGYKKKDVEELKNVLIENSSDKRCAQDMGATIDYAYNLPRQTSKGMKR